MEKKISDIRKLSSFEYNTIINTDMYERLSIDNQQFIRDIKEVILERGFTKGIMQNIDDVLSSKANPYAGYEPRIPYNTYPFGVKTPNTYPRFLAICRNERLDSYMKVLLEQSEKIAAEYPGNDPRDEKTVVLLTDKWDIKVFKKYEHKFLKNATSHGISYIFILITDYGCTPIPFLPYDRHIERTVTDSSWLIDDVRDPKNTIDPRIYDQVRYLLEEFPFEYHEDGGTWDQNRCVDVRFKTDSLKWIRTNSLNETVEGKIKKKALDRFICSIAWLAELGVKPPHQESVCLDAGNRELFVFGHTIKWSLEYEEGNDRLNTVITAINTFMNECVVDLS